MNLSPEVFEISAFRLLILSGAGVTFLSMFIALTLLRDLEMLPDGTLLELEGGVPVTAGGMIGGGAPVPPGGTGTTTAEEDHLTRAGGILEQGPQHSSCGGSGVSLAPSALELLEQGSTRRTASTASGGDSDHTRGVASLSSTQSTMSVDEEVQMLLSGEQPSTSTAAGSVSGQSSVRSSPGKTSSTESASSTSIRQTGHHHQKSSARSAFRSVELEADLASFASVNSLTSVNSFSSARSEALADEDDVRAQDLEDILLAQSLSGSRSSRPVGEAGFQEHLVSDAFSRQRRGFGGGVEGQGASSTSPGKTSSTSASSSTGAGKYVKMATLKSNADVATGFCSASCRPAAPRPQIPLQPPFLKSPCALYSEVFRSDSFWRFFLLVSLLIGVRVIFRYLDALFPKYLIRELGPTALYGSVIALDPLLILFLVPTISLLTMNKISSLNMIIFGSFLSAVAPFWLALGHQYWNSILFICTLAVGEACWSPRLYEYTMRMAEPGKEGTYTALANAPMFCATLIAGSFSGYLLEIFCPENGPKHGEVMWLIVGITSTCSPIALYFARDVIAGVPTVGMGRKMDLGAWKQGARAASSPLGGGDTWNVRNRKELDLAHRYIENKFGWSSAGA
eukprot:CAMPEP_0178989162 /NCGR_PEP_ID=MMETSP0795-20121207/4208_1 /TAXON_ID=88552 /ORGANISM="Amoebophrya sp., Strain Ameob2" /LENGTH=623 /DNA_ID=CAMNT_0020680507 /DNA_START=32 /DNA_END=1903 /DNA_ORIENTATION=+